MINNFQYHSNTIDVKEYLHKGLCHSFIFKCKKYVNVKNVLTTIGCDVSCQFEF